jgi:hypothetical protein
VKKQTLSPSFQEESDAEDDDCCSQALPAMTNSTCTDDFRIISSSLQEQGEFRCIILTFHVASSSNCSSPCIYNILLDHIQRLEQHLTKPCHHCQQPYFSNNNAQTDFKDHPSTLVEKDRKIKTMPKELPK